MREISIKISSVAKSEIKKCKSRYSRSCTRPIGASNCRCDLSDGSIVLSALPLRDECFSWERDSGRHRRKLFGERLSATDKREMQTLRTFWVTGVWDWRLAGNILSSAQQIALHNRPFVFQLTSECFVIILEGKITKESCETRTSRTAVRIHGEFRVSTPRSRVPPFRSPSRETWAGITSKQLSLKALLCFHVVLCYSLNLIKIIAGVFPALLFALRCCSALR